MGGQVLKHRAPGLLLILILALTIPAVGGQTPPAHPTEEPPRPAVFGPAASLWHQVSPAVEWTSAPRPVRFEIASFRSVELEPLDEAMTGLPPVLAATAGPLEVAPKPPARARLIALEPEGMSLQLAFSPLRAETQPSAPPAQPASPPPPSAPPAPAADALKEPFVREIAKCEPAPPQKLGLTVSGALTFTYTLAGIPATTGGNNFTGPGAGTPQVVEPGLELCITLTPGTDVGFFVDVSAKAASDSPALISIDRVYLELRNTFGARDLRFRVGRDRFTLGPLGLLLNEVDLEDQRDGFALWLPPIGPVHLFAFYQYALTDRSTTRRVWGGRAEAEVVPGWTLGVNYRADVADMADVGLCPSSDCATGSGFGVDLEGKIANGLMLTLGYASYTQTQDVQRNHFQAELAIDLKDLAGIHLFEPVLTLWYKTFDPYTIPGSDGTVPRGGFLTPDDFKLFNINDNLTAFGASLELQLLRNVLFQAIGEWGTYKDGGPSYSVYSLGFDIRFPDNIEIKLTYNVYTVGGGSVETSSVSGIELSNTTVYQLEFTKAW